MLKLNLLAFLHPLGQQLLFLFLFWPHFCAAKEGAGVEPLWERRSQSLGRFPYSVSSNRTETVQLEPAPALSTTA